MVGAGVGGILIGLLVGAVGIILLRCSRSCKDHHEDLNLMCDSQLSSGNSQQSREMLGVPTVDHMSHMYGTVIRVLSTIPVNIWGCDCHNCHMAGSQP